MLFNDNFQTVTTYSEETHQFLTEHLIAPCPINYAVIYLYITKKNAQLNTAIDQRFKNNELITADFMEEMYTQFVSLSSNIDQEMLAPFEKNLAETLDKITQQVGNEEQASANLQKLDKHLNNTEHHNSLGSAVNFLISTISKTQLQHKTLAKELSSTQEEINQLREKLASSREEALVDTLTGLLNRRGCDEKLKDINTKDTHTSFVIDIDHFKQVNDNFGHFIGDKVIQRIAKTIQNNVSEKDLAIRFGGEEFLVVMVDKTINQAKTIAEKIRTDIAKMRLIHKDLNKPLPPISVSIGIAENSKTPDWQALFKQADKALYVAKNSGRNRCICA